MVRIGMSTNPEGRIRHWKKQEGHTRSDIIKSGLTYEKAQALEQVEARRRGAHAREGGMHVAGAVWSVYVVWGGTIRA